jgi:hypothetical protein
VIKETGQQETGIKSSLVDFLTLKMDAVCLSETSVNFRVTSHANLNSTLEASVRENEDAFTAELCFSPPSCSILKYPISGDIHALPCLSQTELWWLNECMLGAYYVCAVIETDEKMSTRMQIYFCLPWMLFRTPVAPSCSSCVFDL